MNLAPFLIAMVLMFLAQILTFYQIQGPLKINWFKNNYWLVVLMGIPISMMYMKSIKYLVEAYNGLIWPGRIIGFGVGAFVFTIMAYYVFNETLNLKTIICLLLALAIILIQLFWK